MMAFFNSLDAKLIAFFKGLGKKSKTVSAPLAPADIGAPFRLMVGSLTDCTYKDVEAMVRGLAETFVTSRELARFRVYEDKAKSRFLFELHEGGAGRSIIEKVLEKLETSNQVRLRMVNGAQAVIEESHGEVFSLDYPSEEEAIQAGQLPGMEALEDAPLERLEDYAGDTPLKPVYPVNKKLVHVGGAILGVAISFFMLTGGIYTVIHSGVLTKDILLKQTKDGFLTDANDNPVWQLDKARTAAEKDDKSVRSLKRGPNGWTWELDK